MFGTSNAVTVATTSTFGTVVSEEHAGFIISSEDETCTSVPSTKMHNTAVQ
jgi:hypothetical protein